MSEEECEGCYTIINYDITGGCRLTRMNLTECCPCRECLIKTMCDNDCEAMDDYLDKYNVLEKIGVTI